MKTLLKQITEKAEAYSDIKRIGLVYAYEGWDAYIWWEENDEKVDINYKIRFADPEDALKDLDKRLDKHLALARNTYCRDCNVPKNGACVFCGQK